METEEFTKETIEVVAKVFQPEEIAAMFNALGEIPLKLNSKEITMFNTLREKLKCLHSKYEEML